jgi:hypothetical protein
VAWMGEEGAAGAGLGLDGSGRGGVAGGRDWRARQAAKEEKEWWVRDWRARQGQAAATEARAGAGAGPRGRRRQGGQGHFHFGDREPAQVSRSVGRSVGLWFVAGNRWGGWRSACKDTS